MLGVWIYAKVTKQNFEYVIVGLFGSALGPLVSFLAFWRCTDGLEHSCGVCAESVDLSLQLCKYWFHQVQLV